MNEQMNEWMNNWMNERISEWFNVWINIWQTVEWMNDRVYELKMTVKRFLDRSYELMDEWIIKHMNEWMNEWMNKKTNEWIKKMKRKNGCNKEQIKSWV